MGWQARRWHCRGWATISPGRCLRQPRLQRPSLTWGGAYQLIFLHRLHRLHPVQVLLATTRAFAYDWHKSEPTPGCPAESSGPLTKGSLAWLNRGMACEGLKRSQFSGFSEGPIPIPSAQAGIQSRQPVPYLDAHPGKASPQLISRLSWPPMSVSTPPLPPVRMDPNGFPWSTSSQSLGNPRQSVCSLKLPQNHFQGGS